MSVLFNLSAAGENAGPLGVHDDDEDRVEWGTARPTLPTSSERSDPRPPEPIRRGRARRCHPAPNHSRAATSENMTADSLHQVSSADAVSAGFGRADWPVAAPSPTCIVRWGHKARW